MPPEARCVHCRRRPIEPAWRPFCSERCKLLDLGRWLDGSYRVHGSSSGPAQEPEDEDDQPEP